jgi:RHS repeat-associated protein
MIRFQYTNHLGSAVLELDETADVISYEEYFAYGSTAYQAVRSQTETAKRYRYSWKERDEENDLYYHGARYYASWLGRWVSCDPLGVKDGPNVYAGMACNPISKVDQQGTESGWWDDTINGITEAKKWVKEKAEKAGEMVQDNAERDMNNMGIKEGFVKDVLRTVASVEATLVATTIEVAADVVMLGPNILAGLDSAGKNIGEGAARAYEAKNSDEVLLGIAQVSGGVGEAAIVTIGVLTLGEGAAIRPRAATVPGMTRSEINAAVRQQFTRFEAQVTNDSTSVLTRTAEQVTIEPFTSAPVPGQPLPPTAPEVVLDTVQQQRLTGATKLLDAKSSPTASLTPNQTVGYPLVEQFGGVVRGQAGGAVLPAGTVLPPTNVQIVRPAALIAKKALQATTAIVAEAQVNKRNYQRAIQH